MVVKVEFKGRQRTNEKFTSMQKAQEVVRRYKQDRIEVKELAGIEQILITIGGIVLGYFATDVANRIAQELD